MADPNLEAPDTGDDDKGTPATALGGADLDDPTPGDGDGDQVPAGDAGKGDDDDTKDGDDKGAGDGDAGKSGDDDGSGAPDEYSDFTLPEGVELDETRLGEATSLFKEANLNQEQAQGFIDIFNGALQDFAVAQAEAFTEMTSDWLKQAQADKEIGGDAFNENIATSQKAMAEFGTEELKQALNESGLGNHPEMIRFMTNVGKLISEDNPDGGGSNATGQQSHVDILYPNG